MTNKNTYNITLSTYKELTKIPWEEGDEKMDSFMMDYDTEMIYTTNN